jgi:hypothetical protein
MGTLVLGKQPVGQGYFYAEPAYRALNRTKEVEVAATGEVVAAPVFYCVNAQLFTVQVMAKDGKTPLKFNGQEIPREIKLTTDVPAEATEETKYRADVIYRHLYDAGREWTVTHRVRAGDSSTAEYRLTEKIKEFMTKYPEWTYVSMKVEIYNM